MQRLDLLIELREKIAADARVAVRSIYASLVRPVRDVREVVGSFGRHPHRNAILGRRSTAPDEAYIARGVFPHLKAPQKD